MESLEILVLEHHCVQGRDVLCKSVYIKYFLHLAVGSGGETDLQLALVLLLGGLGMKYGAF